MRKGTVKYTKKEAATPAAAKKQLPKDAECRTLETS